MLETQTFSLRLSKNQVEATMAATAATIARESHSEEVATHLLRFVRFLEDLPVQQELNCCQTTSVAYALSALGFPTSVDDILWMVQVPIESAVGDGMTLAETFDLATRYIHHARLPVFVECHHFDAHAGVTAENLWTACVDDVQAAADEVLVFNFHSGIAHGWPEGGGGHFAVLLGTVGSGSEPGDVVMADVNPLRYGAYWQAPVRRLYASMCDKDSCGRARGLLRFGLTSKALSRPTPAMRAAPALVDWSAPPEGHDPFLLRRFIPKPWDAALGVANMSGMSAVALAANVVQGFGHQLTDLDACMRALRCSYLEHLHEFQSSQKVYAVAKKLASSGLIDKHHDLHLTRIPLGRTGDDLRRALLEARVTEPGVAIILPIDLNVAKGGPYVLLGNTEAAKLSHGPKTWVAVAGVNPAASADDPQGVVLCSTNHVIRDGRLWATSLDRLAAAGHEGLVSDGYGVVFELVQQSNQAHLETLYRKLDQNSDGNVDSQELYDALHELGLPLSREEADQLVAEFNRDADAASLSRNELFEMLTTLLGYHGGHKDGSARHELVARFMKQNGCVRNELGFATCHLAVETSDIPRNVAFYNHLLGWPLYKTVDRAHAGLGEDSYGSSWASYGAFASFVVFHGGAPPIGAQGHGPWANPHDCPAALRRPGPGGCVGSIAFHDIPVVFLGVILEPSFYAKQLARIAKKDPTARWLEVTDVAERFGGDVVERAVVMKDPDGYPLIFFVSTRAGDAYTERHPAVPFVYSAHFRVSPSYGVDVSQISRRITKDMLAQLRSDQLEAHTSYYQDILGCALLSQCERDGRHRLEFAWEGHYLCLKSDPENVAPSLRKDKPGGTGHNMGGNKGFVPVPHFGPNTTYANFAAIRKRVEDAMASHHVPAEDLWCLTLTGRAPPFNHIDGHNMLFPRDPDSCMAMFLTDPSGNAFEAKWYLDFGEMFHHRGEVGVGGLVVDNSMLADHFPPAVLALMDERARRGDADARKAMAEVE